jgi:hypothetical protein
MMKRRVEVQIFPLEQIFECLNKNIGGKICPNQMFFKSLESFQSVDIKNDIGFSIWRYKLKAMMKIKVGEQVLECLNQNYKG